MASNGIARHRASRVVSVCAIRVGFWGSRDTADGWDEEALGARRAPRNPTTPSRAGLQVRPLRHHANAMPAPIDRLVIGGRPRGRPDGSVTGRSRSVSLGAPVACTSVKRKIQDAWKSALMAGPWLCSFHHVVEAVHGQGTIAGTPPPALLGPFSRCTSTALPAALAAASSGPPSRRAVT